MPFRSLCLPTLPREFFFLLFLDLCQTSSPSCPACPVFVLALALVLLGPPAHTPLTKRTLLLFSQYNSVDSVNLLHAKIEETFGMSINVRDLSEHIMKQKEFIKKQGMLPMGAAGMDSDMAMEAMAMGL